MRAPVLPLVLMLILLPAVAGAELWGSAKSRIYHQRLCRWLPQIKQEYRVSFPTVAAAQKAGYRPCGTCRPPGLETTKAASGR